ncbi:MAG: ornithine--oxo-acid transaminase [Flavobacteriaceae bacterium]|nr:ornithine--oxo-acid transaminase [Flavobacteriaceae bacterium]
MQKIIDSIQNHYINLEYNFGAHDYNPLPVVLKKGEGVFLWDVNDKKYYDFLSSYSAVNQGHCHPKIIDELISQSKKLTLTSRAFHNDKLGDYMKFATNLFGYDRLLPMNTGAEAVETAIKISRKWGHTIKGIDENNAQIIVCHNNFHGRTTTIISFSSHSGSKDFFGPHTPGFIHIPYNDINSLNNTLISNKNIVGFLVEPIQGEAGVNVPEDGYLSKAKKICSENNVLFIADEIQTGLGRTGKLLATDYEDARPDILILGKALSGGTIPVSAVLSDSPIMDVIQPGQHGSTFGGNPLASAVAKQALKVLTDDNLIENSRKLGEYFRNEINNYIKSSNIVKLVRGKGLLNAIVINDNSESQTAWNICLRLRDNGLLAKPTHGNIIRFSPPLVITYNQIKDCLSIIKKTLKEFEL